MENAFKDFLADDNATTTRESPESEIVDSVLSASAESLVSTTTSILVSVFGEEPVTTKQQMVDKLFMITDEQLHDVLK